MSEEGAVKPSGGLIPEAEEKCPSKHNNGSTKGICEERVDEQEAVSVHVQESQSFNSQSTFSKEVLLNHLRGVIYGNCIGDAIGLLTEFMTKEEAKLIYLDKKRKWYKNLTPKAAKRPHLEYSMKHDDFHRYRWDTGDWTDDSDQMILILQTLLENNGKIEVNSFAKKLRDWSRHGFPELGDKGGMGLGRTTSHVLGHPEFLTHPHEAANDVWERFGRTVAPNGGVMRTSILGIHNFGEIHQVIKNTQAACKVTHADPRCVASCVAVTTAIATMLRGKHWTEASGFDVEAITQVAFEHAADTLDTEEQKKELKDYMYKMSLEELQLDEPGKIGYTYKCLGAGFWSLRQDDFRSSLEAITFEGGDADTNGAVAGALLGCKLGVTGLPKSWLDELKNKDWLDKHITSYLQLLGLSEVKDDFAMRSTCV